jgi:CMP-N,N'-diacetyllegionaminic acid synthase
MKVLGVIPARAGSKRIPGKNIAPLNGRPLLSYTCQAARESGLFDTIYINTDAPQIRDIARQYGVDAPLLRPASLAQDDTSTSLAMRFFLSYLVERGESYDAVCLLQPTSPLRTAEDIRMAFDLFEENAPCNVVSVSAVAPSSWLGRATKDGRFDRLEGDDTVYRLNGAIYIYPFEGYVRDRLPSKTMMYPMPPDRSVDIDTILDWEYAEFVMQRQQAVMYDPV